MRMLEWICVLIKNTSHHLHFIFLSIVSAVHSCGWMYKTTHCSQIYKRCWHTRFFFIDLWDACCSFSGSIFLFWFATRIFFICFNAQNTSVFSDCPALQLCMKQSVFKPPPSKISSLLWLVSSHTSEPALLTASPISSVVFSASS